MGRCRAATPTARPTHKVSESRHPSHGPVTVESRSRHGGRADCPTRQVSESRCPSRAGCPSCVVGPLGKMVKAIVRVMQYPSRTISDIRVM